MLKLVYDVARVLGAELARTSVGVPAARCLSGLTVARHRRAEYRMRRWAPLRQLIHHGRTEDGARRKACPRHAPPRCRAAGNASRQSSERPPQRHFAWRRTASLHFSVDKPLGSPRRDSPIPIVEAIGRRVIWLPAVVSSKDAVSLALSALNEENALCRLVCSSCAAPADGQEETTALAGEWYNP